MEHAYDPKKLWIIFEEYTDATKIDYKSHWTIKRDGPGDEVHPEVKIIPSRQFLLSYGLCTSQKKLEMS